MPDFKICNIWIKKAVDFDWDFGSTIDLMDKKNRAGRVCRFSVFTPLLQSEQRPFRD